MRKRWILVLVATIFLMVHQFWETEPARVNGLIPFEVQRNLVRLEDRDGTVVMIYEELPETFTLNRPIGDTSWFRNIWNYYRYTQVSDPELIDEEYNFGWETEDSYCTMQGALYRTRFQVEKVNRRLGIVTKRYEEDVYSSNYLYVHFLNEEGEFINHCSLPLMSKVDD